MFRAFPLDGNDREAGLTEHTMISSVQSDRYRQRNTAVLRDVAWVVIGDRFASRAQPESGDLVGKGFAATAMPLPASPAQAASAAALRATRLGLAGDPEGNAGPQIHSFHHATHNVRCGGGRQYHHVACWGQSAPSRFAERQKSHRPPRRVVHFGIRLKQPTPPLLSAALVIDTDPCERRIFSRPESDPSCFPTRRNFEHGAGGATHRLAGCAPIAGTHPTR